MESFDSIKENPEWAFDNVRSVEQWTHGFHRYPAKFLPNVVKKIIEKYHCGRENAIIADLLAGCGTTLVEAKAHGIASVGVDINPVATMITSAKINTLEPERLQRAFYSLSETIDKYTSGMPLELPLHPRIAYWFREQEIHKLAYLYRSIGEGSYSHEEEQFFYVAVSHTLKSCSRWLQCSTKPQRDPQKKIADPLHEFRVHCTRMMRKNEDFYRHLQENCIADVRCEIRLEDAKHTSIPDNSIDTIITSPPYVTSYEYADIHQLTGYWMGFFSNLSEFRKNFIGTSFSGSKSLECTTEHAAKIVEELAAKNKCIAKNVASYFREMDEVASEMYRILKPGGKACIVIGNTKIRDVMITSAEVFMDFLLNKGFCKVDIIKRNIPCKLMPTLRDCVTGRFTTLSSKNCRKVYPCEYIIIVKK